MSAQRLFIGGEWVTTGQTEPVVEPYSGASLGDIHVAGEAEIELAVTAAQKAFIEFRKTTRAERHRLLREIYRRISDAKAELAELLARDAGKPIVQARGEVDRALITFELAAQETFRFGGETIPVDIQPRTAGYGCQVERFPLGPIVALSPFNFPLNLLAHKLAPVIAVGSAMVLKVPPQAPLAALRMASICADAGLPKGVYNALHMPVPLAEKMVRDERFKALSFTGSVGVGWHVKSIAGKKRVLLELGGNAGVLVHDDADIGKAVDKIIFGSFAYAGQVCIKVQRVYAHRAVYDAFLARLVEKTKAVKAGDPLLEDTLVGPIIDRTAFDRILAWVDEARQAGAKVLCGGGGAAPVMQPTIIESADRTLKVSCQEIFGPVTVVAPYENWDHGLALLNDGPFGLQAGIFTYDIRRIRQAYEVLEVGGVVVNDVPTIRIDNYPYGGVKDSGLGREGVRYAMEELTELRALVTNYN